MDNTLGAAAASEVALVPHAEILQMPSLGSSAQLRTQPDAAERCAGSSVAECVNIPPPQAKGRSQPGPATQRLHAGDVINGASKDRS